MTLYLPENQCQSRYALPQHPKDKLWIADEQPMISTLLIKYICGKNINVYNIFRTAP
jgi:hypothetical protein